MISDASRPLRWHRGKRSAWRRARVAMPFIWPSWIEEGPYHHGDSAVLQILGRKPT